MKILDELRQKFIRNNYKTLKSINDSVSIISINNKKYILKEFSVPLKNKQINQQHDFIHFLLSKGLTTPSIVLSIKKENKNYEIQEYIERLSNDYNIEDIVAYISKFHNASFKYKKELSKSAVYNYEFECKNFTLGTLLLGFEQKYYIYPKKNLLDNYNLLSYTNHKYVDDVLKIYDDCYHYFIQNYSIDTHGGWRSARKLLQHHTILTGYLFDSNQLRPALPLFNIKDLVLPFGLAFQAFSLSSKTNSEHDKKWSLKPHRGRWKYLLTPDLIIYF